LKVIVAPFCTLPLVPTSKKVCSVFDVPIVQIWIQTSNCPKNAVYASTPSKIDVNSGMAILQGHIPLELGVVPFCTLPLVATTQKSCIRALPHTSKMENAIFWWQPTKP
jgi:hypothetical protein